MRTFLLIIFAIFQLQNSYELQTIYFNIALPDKPNYRTQSVNLGSEALSLHLYILEQGASYYIVSHTYYPLSIDLSNPDKFFKGVINGMVSNYQGSLVFERALKTNNAIGKKVRVKLPDGDFVEVDYYLKGRTLYQVLIKANVKDIQSSQIQNCFDSFTLY